MVQLLEQIFDRVTGAKCSASIHNWNIEISYDRN